MYQQRGNDEIETLWTCHRCFSFNERRKLEGENSQKVSVHFPRIGSAFIKLKSNVWRTPYVEFNYVLFKEERIHHLEMNLSRRTRSTQRYDEGVSFAKLVHRLRSSSTCAGEKISAVENELIFVDAAREQAVDGDTSILIQYIARRFILRAGRKTTSYISDESILLFLSYRSWSIENELLITSRCRNSLASWLTRVCSRFDHSFNGKEKLSNEYFMACVESAQYASWINRLGFGGCTNERTIYSNAWKANSSASDLVERQKLESLSIRFLPLVLLRSSSLSSSSSSHWYNWVLCSCHSCRIRKFFFLFVFA